MAVALTSLRVTSDFDASGYVRGAAQKVAADQAMIAADKARNASLAQADAALARIPSGMASVSKSLLDGYGAGAQFEAIVRRIGNSVDRGMGLDRANVLLDAAYKKFGLTADAAILAERGFVSIVPAVNELNAALTVYEEKARRADLVTRAFADAKSLLSLQAANQNDINKQLGVSTGGADGAARASADAFLAQFGGLEGVLKAKAQEAGSAFAAELNSRMVAGAAKSARDSASAFDAELKRIDTIAEQRAQQAGSNFQRSLTDALGGGGPSATSQGATYSALAEQVERLDMIEQARATHNAQQFQVTVNLATGIDREAKSARDAASVFVAAAEAEEAMAAKAATLRTQINPLEAEMVSLGKQMADYKGLLNAGVISQEEYGQAQSMAAKRLSDVDMNMRKAATGGRVLSGELGNLGYQVNDVITGLALGQPVFMIAAQQGGQIYQIFSRSRGSVADFAKEYTLSVLSMVTPTRAAFGAVAISVGGAIAALVSYEGKMNEVQRLLAGSGRASGANVFDISRIADQNSSLPGFSVNEARNLAAALASTGKVGVEQIGPIVALGHDFAKTFGVDAKEATDLLAKAFTDPARGADELNQRLGFLDANTKELIQSLVVQGNRQQAVKVLTDALRDSIANASDITSGWGKVGTVAGNLIAKAFEQAGRGADWLISGRDLQERINGLTTELLGLQRAKIEGGFWNWLTTDIDADGRIAKINAELETLSKRRSALQKPSDNGDTANKARGLEIDAIARATLPTIEATRKLEDQTKALNQAFTDPAIGKWVSVVGGDLLLALQRADAAAKAMKGADPIKNQIADTEAQIQALDRRSIADRARFARDSEVRRQSLDPNAGSGSERLEKQNQAARLAAGGQTALDNVERQRISTLGNMASIQDVVRTKQLELDNANREGIRITDTQRAGLIDLAREQALGITAMKQQADSTRIQAETLGMSTGAAAEHTAVQTRLAQALRDKQVLTEQDIAQIKEQAAALGKVTEAAARAAINDNIRFGAKTALLSPDDVQIAQQLKGLYPDVATALNSVEAAGLRTNAALSGLSSTFSGSLTTGFADIVDGTKSVSAGMGDMSKAIIRALEEAIIKLTIVTPLMRAFQLAAGSLGGGLMGGGSPTGYGTGSSALASANGNAFGGSNVIPFARGSAFTNNVFSSPTYFRFANGGGMSNGVMGEAGPEAVMPLRRGRDGKLGVSMNGGGDGGSAARGGGVQVNVYNAPAGHSADVSQRQNTDGSTSIDITLKKLVEGIGVESIASGDMGRAMESKYGAKRFAGA